MAIKVSQLVDEMVEGARDVFGQNWPDVRDFAVTEFKKIAENIALIEKMKMDGTITEEKARLQLDIQKNASQSILLTLEGLGTLIVEQTINAALGAVKDTVNSALGWKLL